MKTESSHVCAGNHRDVGLQKVEGPYRTGKCYLRVPGDPPQPPPAPHRTRDAHTNRTRKTPFRQHDPHATDPSELTPQDRGVVSPPKGTTLYGVWLGREWDGCEYAD